MVDTTDLKSVVSNGVPVRVRPAALSNYKWFVILIAPDSSFSLVIAGSAMVPIFGEVARYKLSETSSGG
jgi:hypothetical protein